MSYQIDPRQRPLISILIPCYNAEASIEAAINSALDQTYERTEVVIVNDGSTDRSAQILESLTDRRVRIFHQSNRGECAARNACMDQSRGEYLLCLDADDRLRKNAIAALYDALDCQYEMAAGLSVRIHEHHREVLTVRHFHYKGDPLASMIRNWWPVSAILFRRPGVRWNEQERSWGVLEFFLRLFLNGYRCALTDQSVTEIDVRANPSRSSVVFDHFDPFRAFHFFNVMKTAVQEHDMLTFERREAFDKHLLHFAYMCCKQSPQAKLEVLPPCLDPSQLPEYDWYNPYGVSAFCRWLGLWRGLRIFYRLNLLIGREK